MENNFNFKSQICTTRQSSERLLALGLKKETADMTIHIKDDDGWYVTAESFCEWEDDRNTFPCLEEPEPIVPAWSLHRLIEILPLLLRKGDNYSLIFDIHRDWVAYMAYASGERNPYNRYLWESQNTNIYDALIDCIEWLIKEGYFSKEYLV